MNKFLRSTFSLAALGVLSLAFGAGSAFGAHGSNGGSSGGSNGGSSGGSSGGSAHASSGGSHGSSGGKHGHKVKKKKHGSSGGSNGGSSGGSNGGSSYGSSGGSSYGSNGGSSGYVTASNVAAPSVASPQMVAYLNVNVPADAKVYLQGQLMTLDGTQRRFFTPAIAQGEQKSYDVKVEVARDGRTVSKTAQAVVAAGQEAEISVSFDEKNPTDLVATVKLASGR